MILGDRFCECGCGSRFTPTLATQRYAARACRQRAFVRRNGRRVRGPKGEFNVPGRPTVESVQARLGIDPATGRRFGEDAPRGVKVEEDEGAM